MALGLATDKLRRISAKTASYYMVPTDVGAILTNRGAAGAVTFTLPPTADIDAGWNVRVFVAADQNVVVASNTADTLTTFNDLQADSIAFQTATELIGGALDFLWDGTGWLVGIMAGETQTVTIAT